MLEKVLIANRGEIAVRVIRACRELGIKSVAIYSEPDANSLHVKMADEAYPLGGALPRDSYLRMDRIIELALKAGADAVHPGYGFLAENAKFAELCERAKLNFVGPSSSTLRTTGNKLLCRRLMRDRGIPVIPGSLEPLKGLEDAKELAEAIGFPILLKSAYGGGGRGIRVVGSKGELGEAFELAKREAFEALGRSDLYVEKLLESPRHIEFQILRDTQGNCVHLFERECSIQRRFQKLVELSPSPVMNDERRSRVGAWAKEAAEAVGYTNAGTVEFLMDAQGNFYFIEFNSRIQVEHPVTEMVTGVDLVKQQLLIAAGEPLPFTQEELGIRGCAIEFRVNAEDPYQDFFPSSGEVKSLHLPAGPGVRVDTALYEGYQVPSYYDSLIAKLIVWGRDFQEATARAKRALSEFRIKGIATTLALHRAIIEDPRFSRGEFSTEFLKGLDLERFANELDERALLLAALYLSTKNARARASLRSVSPSLWRRAPIHSSQLKRGEYGGYGEAP